MNMNVAANVLAGIEDGEFYIQFGVSTVITCMQF